MAGAAMFLAWGLRHNEASFADGLRYIRQAEAIQRGDLREGVIVGIDHPLHPLGIVAAHAIVGGEGPVSWQRAAVGLAFGCLVLMILPLYLLTRELFGDDSAWVGCVVVMVNPLIGQIMANVLSESSFLLFWLWGLWAAVRFLREGRFLWLPLASGFGSLAYLSRPEGLLLPALLVGTLGLLPIHRATRINWPRWWRAVAFVLAGSFVLVGPYMAIKGSLATKPAVGRVLGLAPESPPQAMERERPLPPGQTELETYRLATLRLVAVLRGAVTNPLLPFALLGILVAPPTPARARVWLFLGLVTMTSAFGLVRLHATGGYCTVRHALVPGILLMIASAHGLSWIMNRISIPGRWSGLEREELRPGPVLWAVPLALLVVIPALRVVSQPCPGPFHVYRDAADWLLAHTNVRDPILDMTDWPLYFSDRSGYPFARVYDASFDPDLRWVVVRRPHVEGPWNYSKVVRDLVADRRPVAEIPPQAAPGQLQILIYDRMDPNTSMASAGQARSWK
jgi:hypothetical protein